jgi:hypothetical protein
VLRLLSLNAHIDISDKPVRRYLVTSNEKVLVGDVDIFECRFLSLSMWRKLCYIKRLIRQFAAIL